MKYKNKHQTNHYQRGFGNKATENTKRKINLRVGLGILTIGMIMLYLFQNNCLAITGFEIRELEREIYTLQETNKDLTLHVNQLRSIGNLEKVSQDLAMVRIGQAEHIAYRMSTVALNK